MCKTYHIIIQFIQELGIKVPNSVIRESVDTPIGNTLRGISDTLDSLHINNAVYKLPKKDLEKLNYPYLAVINSEIKPFVVVSNDNIRNNIWPNWDGIALIAEETNKTPIYHNVRLKNCVNQIKENPLASLIVVSLFSYMCLMDQDLKKIIHSILCIIGIYISTLLIESVLSGDFSRHKYCKIGLFFNCEVVLNSKGSVFLGIMHLSDLAFIFFSMLFLFAIIPSDNCIIYSLLILFIGLCFTLYSLVYQLFSLHKICIICMLINFIIWTDTFLLYSFDITFNLNNPHIVIISGAFSIIIWIMYKRLLKKGEEISIIKNKLSYLYRKDIFEALLYREKKYDAFNDDHAIVRGRDCADILTIFIHPRCTNCNKLYQIIPDLESKVKIKIISLEKYNKNIHLYCKKNNINKIPTILFNNRKLPDIYEVEDLKFIL